MHFPSNESSVRNQQREKKRGRREKLGIPKYLSFRKIQHERIYSYFKDGETKNMNRKENPPYFLS